MWAILNLLEKYKEPNKCYNEITNFIIFLLNEYNMFIIDLEKILLY